MKYDNNTTQMLITLNKITGHRKQAMITAINDYYFVLFGEENNHVLINRGNLSSAYLFDVIQKMKQKIINSFESIEDHSRSKKQITENKTLIFEGAGWAEAESNGVGNCRIRTRFINDDNKPIYLEMTGTEITKNMSPYVQHLKHGAFISHCFYSDLEEGCNQTSEIRKFETGLYFEYTKENILKFVNNKLNSSFTALEVVNDNSVRVHDTAEAL